MSRFGLTGTFRYDSGDTFAGATTVVLNSSQMPQYPLAYQSVNDRQTYRSKSGKAWVYENYNLQSYSFNWSLLDEPMRGSLKTMFDAKPILAFYSNGSCFGTFRMGDNTWSDQETAFELYDVAFKVEETR